MINIHFIKFQFDGATTSNMTNKHPLIIVGALFMCIQKIMVKYILKII